LAIRTRMGVAMVDSSVAMRRPRSGFDELQHRPKVGTRPG
jgi:hypothetical protein